MYERQKDRTNHDDVGEFHEKFGLPNTTYEDIGPTPIDTELVLFRVKFMLEEILEFCEATGIDVRVNPKTEGGSVVELSHRREKYQAAEAFDALLDLVYVALGTAHFFGFPWQQGWRLVQRANMSKVRAQADGSDSKRGSALDVVKPEGFQPPNIARLLGHMGWDEYKDAQ